MTNTPEIRALLYASGYKLQHVARVLHITPNTLRRKLDGDTEFKLSEAERLSALLRLTPDQREKYFFGEEQPKGGEMNDLTAAAQNTARPAAVRHAARPHLPGAQSVG